METDAGRAVKTLVTSATTFVYSGAADACGSHILYFQGCGQSLGIEVLEVMLHALDAATVLYLYPSPISPTEPVA